MPRFDGPYHILATDEKHLTVTLDMPNAPNILPVFHTSELRAFKENDATLFPSRAHEPPSPITIDGDREFYIDKIIDERCRGQGRQYLVRWCGEGSENDRWLCASELKNCEALD